VSGAGADGVNASAAINGPAFAVQSHGRQLQNAIRRRLMRGVNKA
jgi:hypothetical protein